MTDHLADTYFEDANLKQSKTSAGGFRLGMKTILRGIREAFGTGDAETLVAAASITPTKSLVLLDNSSTGASLATIALSLPDGHFLALGCTTSDPAKRVTLVHTGSGSGKVNLLGDLDAPLDHVEQLYLLRRAGSLWTEVGREGRSSIIVASYAGTWATPAARTGAQYFLARDLCVVEGVIENPAGISAPSTIFSLAPMFRPAQTQFFVKCTEGADQNQRDPFGVEIQTGGDVRYVPIAGKTYTAGRDVVLTTMAFRVGN